MKECKREYILLQYNEFGSIFAKDGEELEETLNLLSKESDHFKFIVACESGGFRISKLSDF